MANSYATGNTVYNGSSSSSQPGQLDPTGFINREANRSGLAQNAINRGTTDFKPLAPASPTNFQNRTATGSILPDPTVFRPEDVWKPTNPAPKGLPPDSTYNQTAMSAMQDYSSNARQMLQQRQLAERDYMVNLRNYNEQMKEAPVRLRDQAATRGIGRSSMYARAAENLLSDLANYGSDIVANRQLADLAYTSGLADMRSNYNQIMALAAQALSERLAAESGSLGLKEPEEIVLEDSRIGGWIQQLLNK